VNEADWEQRQRVADAWASIDQRSEAEFLTLIGNSPPSCPRTAVPGPEAALKMITMQGGVFGAVATAAELLAAL
jgi:hypothetical protein